MAKVQRIRYPDGRAGHTVIGADFLPIPEVREYLDFLNNDQASPNTIRAYAKGLAEWYTYLGEVEVPWDQFKAADFGYWLAWLRTGDLPGALRIGQPEQLLKASTVQARAAAVMAFYRYHAAANGLTEPHERLYSPLAKRGRRPYSPFLAGIADRGKDRPSPLYKVRSGPMRRPPVLTPAQVQTILDACSTQCADGLWSGSFSALRNRFYFAVLAETGMRPGEALSLRHTDFKIGQGGQPKLCVAARQDHPHTARAKSGQYREVHVSDDLEGLYSEYVTALVDSCADMIVENFTDSFVFVNSPTSTGEPFAPLRYETVQAAVRAINRKHPQLPPWSPHWLRHTHATALLLSGSAPHVVMRRLGHLDVQTTLSVYGWVTEDVELRAVSDWKKYAVGRKEEH